MALHTTPKLIEERKKANEEWSKKTQDSHDKNEQDLEKHLDRVASIEQNKIGLKKDAELTKMYEDGNLTVKEKLQKNIQISNENAIDIYTFNLNLPLYSVHSGT